MQISLRAARINAGLDQKEAAKSLGVSRDTLSNWERGKSFPNAERIRLIEKLYGVSYDDIIFLPRDTLKA